MCCLVVCDKQTTCQQLVLKTLFLNSAIPCTHRGLTDLNGAVVQVLYLSNNVNKMMSDRKRQRSRISILKGFSDGRQTTFVTKECNVDQESFGYFSILQYQIKIIISNGVGICIDLSRIPTHHMHHQLSLQVINY